VLKKIDNAFNQGDPALILASAGFDDPNEPWYHSSPESSTSADFHKYPCFTPHLFPLFDLQQLYFLSYKKNHTPFYEDRIFESSKLAVS
jgi:hypothetical protein